ncbi:MAG TPA: hypothetical protein VI912_03980 [Candidatus Bilamarchaeaceae archaeon]|nr:hypothetical protein [Candidatus Bilamarchaeaceae archaeon]
MKKVYECDLSKKKEIIKILEADPYEQDSFARIGYKLKDGSSLEEDKTKLYIYFSASNEFLKKADEKLKDLINKINPVVEKRITEKIEKEEENAESGLGDIFG